MVIITGVSLVKIPLFKGVSKVLLPRKEPQDSPDFAI